MRGAGLLLRCASGFWLLNKINQQQQQVALSAAANCWCCVYVGARLWCVMWWWRCDNQRLKRFIHREFMSRRSLHFAESQNQSVKEICRICVYKFILIILCLALLFHECEWVVVVGARFTRLILISLSVFVSFVIFNFYSLGLRLQQRCCRPPMTESDDKHFTRSFKI